MADKYILLINDTTGNITSSLDNNKIAIDTTLNQLKHKSGGTIYAYAREGQNTNFADTTVAGDLTVDEYIIHSGDTDTNIRFQANQVSVDGGGVTFLNLTTADHTLALNDDLGGSKLVIVDDGANTKHSFDSLGQRENRYDNSNYITETVGSGGDLTLGLTGGDTVTINDYVTIKASANTNTDTETTLASVTLSENDVLSIEIDVVAGDTDAGNTAIYKLAGLFKREAGGSAAQVGTTTAIKEYEEDSNWDCDFDTDSNDVRVRITGSATKYINWQGYIKYHIDSAPSSIVDNITVTESVTVSVA